MKSLIAAFVCLMLSTVAYADDDMIPVSMLPQTVKTFVTDHFPGINIAYAEKEHGKYEVHLNDGTELEFDRGGTWETIDCQIRAVPSQIVPAGISDYVKANFNGQLITKIDKERYGYQIELSNDLELKFNKAGNFLCYDD